MIIDGIARGGRVGLVGIENRLLQLWRCPDASRLRGQLFGPLADSVLVPVV